MIPWYKNKPGPPFKLPPEQIRVIRRNFNVNQYMIDEHTELKKKLRWNSTKQYVAIINAMKAELELQNMHKAEKLDYYVAWAKTQTHSTSKKPTIRGLFHEKGIKRVGRYIHIYSMNKTSDQKVTVRWRDVENIGNEKEWRVSSMYIRKIDKKVLEVFYPEGVVIYG